MKIVFFFCTEFEDPDKGSVWFRTRGTFDSSKGSWTLYFFPKSDHKSCVHGCNSQQDAIAELRESQEWLEKQLDDVKLLMQL